MLNYRLSVYILRLSENKQHHTEMWDQAEPLPWLHATDLHWQRTAWHWLYTAAPVGALCWAAARHLWYHWQVWCQTILFISTDNTKYYYSPTVELLFASPCSKILWYRYFFIYPSIWFKIDVYPIDVSAGLLLILAILCKPQQHVVQYLNNTFCFLYYSNLLNFN